MQKDHFSKMPFLSPIAKTPRFSEDYGRFNETVCWSLELIASGCLTSREIIHRNHNNVVTSRDIHSFREVDLLWAEYDLRRRLHFAAELLLSALTQTLNYLNKAALPNIVQGWSSEYEETDFITHCIGNNDNPYNLSLEDFIDQLDYAMIDEYSSQVRSANSLKPPEKAIFALTLMSYCHRKSLPLRRSNSIPDRSHYMEKSFKIIEAQARQTVSETLEVLLRRVVIESHLKTTLRKMGQGQKCSLRFYPEGGVLAPTGTSVSAGHSQDRLRNVLVMLSDLGLCSRENGRLSLTANGRTWLDSRRGAVL